MRVGRSTAVGVAVVALGLSGCADDERLGTLPTVRPLSELADTSTSGPTKEPRPWASARVSTRTPTATPKPTRTAKPPVSPKPTPTNEPSPAPDPRLAAEREVVRLTNAERARHGCGRLRIDDRLHEAARAHSDDMATRDYLDHVSPDGVGPGERAEAAGYDAWGAENIASGYQTAEDVVEGWMSSQGHRDNILNCSLRAIGVGMIDSYWTQTFGYE